MERYMIESVEGFQEMSDRLKVTVCTLSSTLDYACREERAGRMLEMMWK